ncbi:MAG: hypothetical protein BWK75_05235 [Candidatus Altiarchaeales archaeon A3]|nr:MAG: hypothetical protein BWK75_05235 [Candidatus Altiarchaeales archaeon A3]
MIKISDLSLKFKDFSLEDINLDIKDGEYFILVGPSGSGKTLLIECLAGIKKVEKGRILINSREVTNLSPDERNIGYVPQDLALFPFLNVEENITFGMKIRKYTKEEILAKLNNLADILKIKNLLARNVWTLSGGEQQRVAIARALSVNPAVLLLDEPLSTLDPKIKQDLWTELKRLHKELNVTTIHVTHDFEEAMCLGDRIAIINSGKILQCGNVDEIFRCPKSKFAAEFVGIENLLKGYVKIKDGMSKIKINENVEIFSTRLISDIIGEGKDDKRDDEVYVAIRPEDVGIVKHECRCEDKNAFKGKIVEITDRGTLIKIKIDAGILFTSLLTRRTYFEKELKEGEYVHVVFRAKDVYIFKE